MLSESLIWKVVDSLTPIPYVPTIYFLLRLNET